jgi:hypothetical protein
MSRPRSFGRLLADQAYAAGHHPCGKGDDGLDRVVADGDVVEPETSAEKG